MGKIRNLVGHAGERRKNTPRPDHAFQFKRNQLKNDQVKEELTGGMVPLSDFTLMIYSETVIEKSGSHVFHPEIN